MIGISQTSKPEKQSDGKNEPREKQRHEFYRETYREYQEEGGVPISVLHPSAHLSSALLRRNRLDLVSDVVAYDYEDLCSMIGRKAADELQRLLEPHGLYLGMADDEMAEAFGSEFYQD